MTNDRERRPNWHDLALCVYQLTGAGGGKNPGAGVRLWMCGNAALLHDNSGLHKQATFLKCDEQRWPLLSAPSILFQNNSVFPIFALSDSLNLRVFTVKAAQGAFPLPLPLSLRETLMHHNPTRCCKNGKASLMKALNLSRAASTVQCDVHSLR